MLSAPLMLFRSGDASLTSDLRVLVARSKAPIGDWLGQFFTGMGTHLAALREAKSRSLKARCSYYVQSNRQNEATERRGGDDERLSSSPCPSSSSSSDSSSSPSSGSSSSDSSDSSSDNEEEALPPSANGGGDKGENDKGGDDDQKKKKDNVDEDGNNSDSSSDSSADESDQEEDDGVMIDTDDEKDKAHNLIDPTDEDLSDSDGSSDLENSYPQLPSAPVDTLIAFRQRAAQKELQMSEKLKKEVIADARQRHQERQQALRSKKKKKSPQSKRRHSKQSDSIFNGSNHTNGSTGTADAMEDEWMVDCSCGLKEKNYDDGTSMIQCDSCSHWVHAKCADKQPEAVAQEKFLCFRCGWMFDCVCDIRRQLNHDDGQRMVECESCETWQHTKCVGIPMTEEPADDYRCPRCVKKARRRKSGSKSSGSRDRQRKRSHREQSRNHRKNSDLSPPVAIDVRSAARSLDALTMPTRSHSSRRGEHKESPKMKRKASLAQSPSPPPVPAVSPPSTPPPPPSSPPPPSARSARDRSHSRVKRRSERERDRASTSSSPSHRKRGRSMGDSPSSLKKPHSETSDKGQHPAIPTTVTPSPRGKGLMLRGYSPASARTDAPSLRSADVRPPLPLTPPSGGSNSSHNNHSQVGRKRKGSSARDRLAKKLKIRKNSLR
ncbi:Pleckstrin homology domain-containing proteinD [Phytophthora infestans]|uniref:Pleckstrin homology domain-containing proteinD n=1 Tax=Phytophthora infestans TaxID=4787 RepID=A0A833SPE5_PHYIN|nr:Pleckstrin homology domain-containing proteinD [Phytophthora infestans]